MSEYIENLKMRYMKYPTEVLEIQIKVLKEFHEQNIEEIQMIKSIIKDRKEL